MKKFALFTLAIFSSTLFAKSITEYNHYEYEVLFTNPICREYKYDKPVTANNGETLYAKPKNVYCKPSDAKISAERADSPQTRLLEWINDSKTNEIYMTYFTFSNQAVANALCDRLEKGNFKLSLILDLANTEDTKLTDKLKACDKNNGNFNLYYRGNTGGIGLAHNKILMVNPNDKVKSKIVFSSGNMSSGVVLHHENWNFITVNSESFFAQVHVCVFDGMINHSKNKQEFKTFFTECRSKIQAKEEDDIKTFFIPVDGNFATKAIQTEFAKADSIFVTSHRFSSANIMAEIKKYSSKKEINVVVEDDIYWTGKLNKPIGRNSQDEAQKVEELVKASANVRYLETNQNAILLTHNKFIVFNKGNETTVFTGAGNLTGAAFTTNFENFYMVNIPEITKAYKEQSEKLFKMATPEERLPSEYVLP